MDDKLSTTAKQVGLELIGLSDAYAANMQTWGDVLTQNPQSVTAKMSAGFVTKPESLFPLEMVVDVQTPPNEPPVARIWGIQTKIGADQRSFFNNIQLNFAIDPQEAARLVAKGGSITRDDIRPLLQGQSARLSRVVVSIDAGINSTGQLQGERYDLTADQLSQHPESAAKVEQNLLLVLQMLKQSMQQTPMQQAPTPQA